MYNEFSTSSDLDGTVRIPYPQQSTNYIDPQIQIHELPNFVNTHDVRFPCPPNLSNHLGQLELDNLQSSKKKLNSSRPTRLSHSADNSPKSNLPGTYLGDQHQANINYRIPGSKMKINEELGRLEAPSVEITDHLMNQNHENEDMAKDLPKSIVNFDQKADGLVRERTVDLYDCDDNGLSNSNALGLIFTSDTLGSDINDVLLPQLALPKAYDVQFQNLGNYPVMDPHSNTFELRIRDRSSSRSPYDVRLRSKEEHPVEKKTRYVTELKMNLRGGRAQHVVRNWKTASSDRDSASETGDDLVEDPSTQVRAVLCRANRQCSLPRVVRNNRYEVQQQPQQSGQVEIKLMPDNCCANSLYLSPDTATPISPNAKMYPDRCDPDSRQKETMYENMNGFDLRLPNYVAQVRQEARVGSEQRSLLDSRSHSNFSVRVADSGYDTSMAKQTSSPKQGHLPDTPLVNLMAKPKSVSPLQKRMHHSLDRKPVELGGSHEVSTPKQIADTLSSGLDMDSLLKGMPIPHICSLVKQTQNTVSSEDVSVMTENFQAPNVSPQVDEPSNKTLVDGCSACTIISPKDGKTSRGTQSELFEQVKIVRDMQIQTLQEESDPIRQKEASPLKPPPPQPQLNRTPSALPKPIQPVSRLPVLTANYWTNDWRPTDHIEPVRHFNSVEETPDLSADPERGSAVTATPSSFLVFPQRPCPNPDELKQIQNNSINLNKPAVCSGDYTFTADMITNETNTMVGDSFPEIMGTNKILRGQSSCPNEFRDLPVGKTITTDTLGRARPSNPPNYYSNLVPTKEVDVLSEDGKGDIRDTNQTKVKQPERSTVPSKNNKITSSPPCVIKKKYSPPRSNQMRNYVSESNGVVIVEENSTPTPWRLYPERYRNESHYIQSQKLGCPVGNTTTTTVIPTGNPQLTRTVPQGLRINSPNESLESCIDECCACIHHESTSETHTCSCDCCNTSGHLNNDHQAELKKLRMKNQVVPSRMKEKEHICSIICEPSYVASNVKLPTDYSVSKSVYDYTESRCSCCRSMGNTHSTISHCFQRFGRYHTKEINDSLVVSSTPYAYNPTEQHHQDCTTGHHQSGQRQPVRRTVQPRIMHPPVTKPIRFSSSMHQQKQPAVRSLSPHLGTKNAVNLHEPDSFNRCNNQAVNFNLAGQRTAVETQVIHSATVKKSLNPTEDPPVQIKPQQAGDLVESKPTEDPNQKSAALTKDPQIDALFKMVGEKEKRNILQRWLLEQLAYSTKKTASSANYNVLPTSATKGRINDASANKSETEDETDSDTLCSCSECQAQGDVTSSSSRTRSISDSPNVRPNTSSEMSGSSSQCIASLVSAENHIEYPVQRPTVPKGRATKFMREIGSVPSSNFRTSDGRPGEPEFPSRQSVQRPVQQQQQQQLRQADRFSDRRVIPSSTSRLPSDQIPFSHKPRTIQRSTRLRSTGIVDGDRGDRPLSKIRTIDKQNQGNATSRFVIRGQSRERQGDGGNQAKFLDPWLRYGRNIFNQAPGPNNRPPNGQFRRNRMTSTADKLQQQRQQQQAVGRQAVMNYGLNNRTLRTNSASLESRGLGSSRIKAGYPGRLGDNGSHITGHHSTERTRFECERIYELSPYDDLIKSHLNMADRRIKAVATKNGCEIIINGPITTSDSTLNILNGRNKVIYQCHVFGSSEDRILKCVNFLKETFPNSFIRSNWRA